MLLADAIKVRKEITFKYSSGADGYREFSGLTFSNLLA